MRDRDHGRAGFHREHGASGVVTPAHPRRHARPFREDHHAAAAAQSIHAVTYHLAQRPGSGVAIDGDRLAGGESPAEKRNPQQFALQHPGLGRKDDLECNGFPCRLVLGQDHVWRRRELVEATHAIT